MPGKGRHQPSIQASGCVDPNLLLVGINTQKCIRRAPAKGAGHQWDYTNRTPPGLKIKPGTNNYYSRYHADHPVCFTYVTLHDLVLSKCGQYRFGGTDPEVTRGFDQ